MKRLLQPLSPRLSKNFGSYADRFKQHEKNVRKAADLCHMIEESKERASARELAQASRELEKKQFEGQNYLSKMRLSSTYLICFRRETKKAITIAVSSQCGTEAREHSKVQASRKLQLDIYYARV
jgi:hypothetical protein